jgi:hypothetical protein
MPIGGTRQNTVAGTSYRKDPLYSFAKAFCETATHILNEDGTDIFEEPTKVMRRASTKETMKRFFVEDSVDTNNSELEPDDIEDSQEMMEEQFENDCHAMFEHAPLTEYNPVVGMALPIHKLILMNNVFDKGGIQKVTAVQPKFTISLERRILVTPEGEELDMFLDQNKMTAAIDATNPMKDFELTLPQTEEDNDILGELGGTSLDSLGIDTYISAVKVENVVIEAGDILPDDDGFIEKGGQIADEEKTTDVWFHTNIRFTPNYGGPNHFERTVMQPLTINCKQKVDGATKQVEIKEAISGSMNKNKFNISATYGKITAVKLSAKLDTSNAMLETCQVKWKVDTDLVEIPTNIPINTTISPREVKDLAAMYNVNQLTKLMGMFKNAMSNYKDDHIKMELDNSYKRMDERTSFWGKFDFAPRDGYALDHVEWRHKTFMDFLDGYVTKMLQVLNDPNMTITIFGDPEIVRKITPKEYSYQAPANIGPVTLDYTQTIVNTADKRVYNFIGSDKMRGTNQLMVLLNPRNTDRIIYRIYDYQLYISNEIRNIANPALPAIHAYEDWKFVEYQPVQGRIQILNPTGLVEA